MQLLDRARDPRHGHEPAAEPAGPHGITAVPRTGPHVLRVSGVTSARAEQVR